MPELFQLFMPLRKADEAKKLVWARAAVEMPDKSNEIMDYETAKPEFQTWSGRYADVTMGKSLGNVRAMHNRQHLAGKVQEIVYNDEEKAVDVCIKVLDPVDWHKIEEGGYTGISMGGGYVNRWADTLLKGHTRYTPRIQEISFVDAPCIPGALIMDMQKMDGGTVPILLKGFTPRTFAELASPRTFGELEKGILGLGLGTLAGGYAGRRIGALAGIAHGAASGDPLRIARSAAIGSEVGRVTGAVAGGALGLHVTRRRDSDGRIIGVKSAKVAKQELLNNLNKLIFAGPGNIAARTGLGDAVKDELFSTKPRKPKMPKAGVGTSNPGIVKQELLETLAKSTASAVGSFLSRGKTIVTKPIDLAANTRGGAISMDTAATSRPLTYQSRGKTFSTVKQPISKQDLLMTLERLGKLAASPSSAAQREKVRQVLHEFKHSKLRSWRGENPETGKPRKGPKVTDRRQAIAIALNQARRMGKEEPALVMAIADQLEKRFAKGSASMPRSRADMPAADSAARKKGARARWQAEDHPDLDVAHDAGIEHARRALLGRDRKVANAEAVKHNAWHAVADSHAAYDKVREHVPEGHGLMMGVTGHPTLLNNPEGIGAHDFDEKGKAKRPIYMLHPDEADDWISKHGKGKVTKETPAGLLIDLAQFTDETTRLAA